MAAKKQAKKKQVKARTAKAKGSTASTQKSKSQRSGGTTVASSLESAIEMLKNDHRHVEELFAAFEKAEDESEKEQLAEEVCTELIVHAMIEEEIFYPACREHVEDSMLDEAQVEHDSAKVLIGTILSGSLEEPQLAAMVKVLSEQIKHHVGEEEKKAESIFKQALESGLDDESLAERMEERKNELMSEAESGELPLPEPRVLFPPPRRGGAFQDRNRRTSGSLDRNRSSFGDRNRMFEGRERGRYGSMRDQDFDEMSRSRPQSMRGSQWNDLDERWQRPESSSYRNYRGQDEDSWPESESWRERDAWREGRSRESSDRYQAQPPYGSGYGSGNRDFGERAERTSSGRGSNRYGSDAETRSRGGRGFQDRNEFQSRGIRGQGFHDEDVPRSARGRSSDDNARGRSSEDNARGRSSDDNAWRGGRGRRGSQDE